ncbi:substrate-binding domain-containing protein [Sinorhizobium meliloti]|jgi:ribose transport system substrate-binding protein|uniref:Sugar-binding periplasmic protein n=4 Tax=Rhizobium meliloti TaxID=382 RepID=Q92MP7_RHIME|nr:substrate-binding domain-containing protein [Sinorhizobium meliloti]PST24482.1 ABC transporter substrate-binding protein [Mesorhizobium loti]TWA97595.1 monosaccharide ABC transporter substrate-binding protein (CUT2 family) [Ensifer sp. SEMIA 134]TWB33221.1 monosaccharide ABC transporter substrate-binding protein (CUT2 family) [Ensifer sp. SEMIA 135]AEG05294.1 periplasmic binding protein/LacI transcriptional regulator [Sinorhizobium meliloti BL225C]AEG54326.1 periplasmic binding protein/LacI
MSSIKTLLAGSVALFCLTSAAMAEECKVGLTMPSLNAPYFAAQVAAVEKAAKDQGCEITTADSQNDFSKQINDVEDMIAKGIDILILNPRDQEALVPAADAATKAGVKVVVMDSTLNPKANVVTQVRSSNEENGRLVGDWIAKKMKGTPIKMLLLSGNQGNPGGLDRRMGVIKGIVEGQLVNEGAVNLQILGQGWGDWATDGGLKAAEDLFQAHPDANLVVGENDSMVLGAVQAAKAAGLDGILFAAAADGQREALEMVKEGTYGATGLNDPDLVGRTAFDIAYKAFKGELPADFPKLHLTPADVISADNVDKYYNPQSVF